MKIQKHHTTVTAASHHRYSTTFHQFMSHEAQIVKIQKRHTTITGASHHRYSTTFHQFINHETRIEKIQKCHTTTTEASHHRYSTIRCTRHFGESCLLAANDGLTFQAVTTLVVHIPRKRYNACQEYKGYDQMTVQERLGQPRRCVEEWKRKS